MERFYESRSHCHRSRRKYKWTVSIENIYQSFNAPIYRVSLNTAEFIKYLSNTLLATLISFANEQSLIARSIGDIEIKNAFQVSTSR